jgi:hypothetical protein
MNEEGSMRHSSLSPWKERYVKAIRESDKKKLTELVFAAEEGIFVRGQELRDSKNHHEELSEMSAAAADLLVIKVYKLGWPSPKISIAR